MSNRPSAASMFSSFAKFFKSIDDRTLADLEDKIRLDVTTSDYRSHFADHQNTPDPSPTGPMESASGGGAASWTARSSADRGSSPPVDLSLKAKIDSMEKSIGALAQLIKELMKTRDILADDDAGKR